MWILHQLTGSPVLFAEFLGFDKKRNTVLMGHQGAAGIGMARSPKEVTLTVPHVPPYGIPGVPHGIAVEFIIRPGRVTILNISCDAQGYKMVIASGEAVDTPPRHIHFPHAIIRLNKPVDIFFRELTSEA